MAKSITNIDRFQHLFKWDLLQLHRQNLLVISAIIVAIYVGIFYLLRPLGNLDNIFIILIFNEPVVTGYMFGGVIMLFEKSQNTLQATRVLPVSGKQFILSKVVLLSGLSWLTAIILGVSTKGFSINLIHLSAGMIGMAALFTCAGMVMGYLARTFNHFLFYTILVIMPMAVPFLSLFDLGESWWYIWIPSYPALLLIQASITDIPLWQMIYGYGFLTVCVWAGWKMALNRLPYLT